MLAEVATQGSEWRTGASCGGGAGPEPGRLACEGLIEKFNQAVRRPGAHGGVSVLPLLLDLIAEADPQTMDAVWIPDTNERLGTAALVRHYFADPDIHVTASQYGEDAYRRGWLRLDCTLSAQDHAALVERAADWAGTDRTLRDVLGAIVNTCGWLGYGGGLVPRMACQPECGVAEVRSWTPVPRRVTSAVWTGSSSSTERPK
jgi:hypothetical protein